MITTPACGFALRWRVAATRTLLLSIPVDLRVLSAGDVERVVSAMRRRQDSMKFGEMARSLGLATEEHILAALAVQLHLFPGIQDLSMNRLLDTLQRPAVVGLA